MTLQNLLDLDVSNALWPLMMIETGAKDGPKLDVGLLFDWFKEMEGHLRAYQAVTEKLRAYAKKKYGSGEEMEKEELQKLEKKFQDIQAKLLTQNVTFQSSTPVFNYEDVHKLPGMSVQKIAVLDLAGMIRQEVQTKAQQDAYDSTLKSLTNTLSAVIEDQVD